MSVFDEQMSDDVLDRIHDLIQAGSLGARGGMFFTREQLKEDQGEAEDGEFCAYDFSQYCYWWIPDDGDISRSVGYDSVEDIYDAWA